MRRHLGPAVLSLFACSALFACGPEGAEVATTTTTTVQAQGGGNLQLATTSGMYVVDHPYAGEASMTGWIIVMAGQSLPPADTVVTINGVALVRVSGVIQRYWAVDPAGPQPAIGADGLMTIKAVSSAGSRTLTLTCPPVAQVTANPAAGSALTVGGVLSLSWTPGLPTYNSTEASFGIASPSATLSGYDPVANALGNYSSQVPLGTGYTSANLAVNAVPQPGYVAELKYPGDYLLDGNSGGACGRVVRTFFP